jgi:hypothetical protein
MAFPIFTESVEWSMSTMAMGISFTVLFLKIKYISKMPVSGPKKSRNLYAGFCLIRVTSRRSTAQSGCFENDILLIGLK